VAEGGKRMAPVYPRPPNPPGGGRAPKPSPMEDGARCRGLPVLTSKTLRDDAVQAAFRSHAADVAVVVAYGLILPPPILTGVPLGCFNLHASLLPRWRGAAPINRAIMAGAAETGAEGMKKGEGPGTGPIAPAAPGPHGADR